MNAPLFNGPAQSRSGRMPPRIDASVASMIRWYEHISLGYANPSKIVLIPHRSLNPACRATRAASLLSLGATAANPLTACRPEAQQHLCHTGFRRQSFHCLKTAPSLYSQPQSHEAPHQRRRQHPSNHSMLRLIDQARMATA